MEGSCAVRTDELHWLFARTVVGKMEARFSLAKCNIQALGFYNPGRKPPLQLLWEILEIWREKKEREREIHCQVLSYTALRQKGRKRFGMTVQEIGGWTETCCELLGHWRE